MSVSFHCCVLSGEDLCVGLITYLEESWPRHLRPGSVAVRLLGLRVRVPLAAWMSVSCYCCVLSGKDLCVGLITHLEESYRVWCVWMRPQSSTMWRPRSIRGSRANGKKDKVISEQLIGKDTKRKSRGLIWGTIPSFVWRKCAKSQSQDIPSRRQYFNMLRAEHKARVTSTRPPHVSTFPAEIQSKKCNALEP
jgi:hypothetical protein